MKFKSETVLLLSGGVDSALLAFEARPKLCIFVDYGQPSAKPEAAAAERIAAQIGAKLKSFHIPLWLGAMRPGVDPGGLCIVPHRNAVQLAIGVNQAALVGARVVLYGANYDDMLYPDCNRDWIEDYNRLLSRELPIAIHAPLLYYTKKRIMRIAKRLIPNIKDCWSCYGPGPEPCGECKSCKILLEAIA